MEAGEFEIEFFAHACMRVSAGGTTLFTDPWLTGPAFVRGWWLAHQPRADWLAELASAETSQHACAQSWRTCFVTVGFVWCFVSSDAEAVTRGRVTVTKVAPTLERKRSCDRVLKTLQCIYYLSAILAAAALAVANMYTRTCIVYAALTPRLATLPLTPLNPSQERSW